ncbi:hypothetical protein BIV25_28725 [Streptomyces sp. MUSC 14]|nr:hypothetical protein BIV25_28725 [Streptomyces sp. MUSC 14]
MQLLCCREHFAVTWMQDHPHALGEQGWAAAGCLVMPGPSPQGSHEDDLAAARTRIRRMIREKNGREIT